MFPLNGVIINDPIQANLITWVAIFQRVAPTIAHAKDGLYYNPHLSDVFLPFAINVFVCLYQ
jgi:hypothetical protein